MVLIGCGTFDQAARDRMRATLDERTDEELWQRMERLEQEYPDPDQRLRAVGDLMDPLYTCDPICSDPVCSDNDGEGVDGRGHDESWEDMLRLQDASTRRASRPSTCPCSCFTGPSTLIPDR